MNEGDDNGGFGSLDKMVAGSKVVVDGDIVVNPWDRGEICLGWKYLDKSVRPWQGFGLGKSQDIELSHGGLQPWVNIGSVMEVRWRYARLRTVLDTEKTCDYDVEGGFSGHLPTLLDY